MCACWLSLWVSGCTLVVGCGVVCVLGKVSMLGVLGVVLVRDQFIHV